MNRIYLGLMVSLLGILLTGFGFWGGADMGALTGAMVMLAGMGVTLIGVGLVNQD